MSEEVITEEQKKAVEEIFKKKSPIETEEEQKTKDETEDVKENVQNLELGAMQQKVKELTEIEARVDKKIAALKEVVDESKRHGKGFVVPKPKEKTEDEKLQEQANKVLESLGYKAM